MVAIRQAKPHDVDEMKQLLQSSDLYADDLEKHIQHFFVVEQQDTQSLVGMIGMEVYEKFGLLRSFVLERRVWDLNRSLSLIHTILSYAQSQNIEKVYLITKQGSPFFATLGFRTIASTDLPPVLQQSEHAKRVHTEGESMVVDVSGF